MMKNRKMEMREKKLKVKQVTVKYLLNAKLLTFSQIHSWITV